MLAERFVATPQGCGPFKNVRVLGADEAAPEGAVVVEGTFVTLDPDRGGPPRAGSAPAAVAAIFV